MNYEKLKIRNLTTKQVRSFMVEMMELTPSITKLRLKKSVTGKQYDNGFIRGVEHEHVFFVDDLWRNSGKIAWDQGAVAKRGSSLVRLLGRGVCSLVRLPWILYLL